MPQTILLSIIIVNYNSGPNLKKTLSTLGEYAEHDAVELILIDGKSTDCSVRDAEEFMPFVAKYISEKDNGIYDAMNKGIKLSRGNWIWFVNSGDTPTNTCHQTTDLIVRAEREEANFIFSDLIAGRKLLIQKFDLKTMLFAMINHQNIIYHKSLLEDGYDVSFKYCADYFHLLNNFKYIIPYKSTKPLCNYDTDGVSSRFSRKRRVELWMERLKAQRMARMRTAVKILFIMTSAVVIVAKIINPRIGSKISSVH